MRPAGGGDPQPVIMGQLDGAFFAFDEDGGLRKGLAFQVVPGVGHVDGHGGLTLSHLRMIVATSSPAMSGWILWVWQYRMSASPNRKRAVSRVWCRGR